MSTGQQETIPKHPQQQSYILFRSSKLLQRIHSSSFPIPDPDDSEPEFLNFQGARESFPRNQFRLVAWRAGTTTLFLLGT
jgi:hypothetical protein